MANKVSLPSENGQPGGLRHETEELLPPVASSSRVGPSFRPSLVLVTNQLFVILTSICALIVLDTIKRFHGPLRAGDEKT